MSRKQKYEKVKKNKENERKLKWVIILFRQLSGINRIST